ncbi:hypothetical protein V6N13_068477 [Hibiscus sabdariffa]|uniref:Uncharacterized protein n=1 Tax=Hibiscus sabdariffa TaxID=183260 RepID=A0ABR2QMW0_9ROSI
MVVVDVCGGTGFITLVIVKHATFPDRSPHQLAKAKQNEPLEQSKLGPTAEDVSKPVNPTAFLFRFMLGAMAATYHVLIPYLHLAQRSNCTIESTNPKRECSFAAPSKLHTFL